MFIDTDPAANRPDCHTSTTGHTPTLVRAYRAQAEVPVEDPQMVMAAQYRAPSLRPELERTYRVDQHYYI